MSSTAIIDPERQLRRIGGLCRESSGMELLSQVTSALNEVVHYDAAFWSAADPLTGISTSPALVENHPEAACAPFWHIEHHTEDALQFEVLTRAEHPYGSLHDLTSGDLAASPRYVDLHRHFGMGDELRVAMRSGTSCWGVGSLSRADGEAPFTAEEQSFVAAVAGHIGSALRQMTIERCLEATPTYDTPGIATVDPAGSVLSCNTEFARWVEEIPTWRVHEGASGRSVPTEINSLVSRALATHAAGSAQSARARVRGTSGRWIAVHASCLQTSGRDPLVGVVIEPAPESEVASIMIEAYGLTPREREVATQVARGLSTPEIAQELFLSPHTVRDYIKTIFEKVGVSSRGEMVAALFTTLWSSGPREILHLQR